MTEARVIFVEDDDRLRKNIVELLRLEGFDVAGTATALEFFQELSLHRYDVAIVDLGLPDKSGYEIVKSLRESTKLGIIILTARDGMNDKLKGYECGADSYFVKPVDCRELAAAIRSLMSRLERDVTDAPKEEAETKWDLDKQTRTLVSPANVQIKLTAKEWAFIEALKAKEGEPVSRETLLTTLGYNADGPYGSRALDVMVVRLRKKIKEETGLESPILTVYSFGYSFAGALH